MENEKQGAFACASDYGYQQGLTKREYFAAMAMQGYIVERHAQDNTDRRKIAGWSVKMADELLKALETIKPE